MAFTKGQSGNPAGRPRRAEKHAGAVTKAEKQIADRLPALVDLMFELAEGVTVKETDKDGREKVYTRAPDRQAIEYLVNRIMGKPTERQEQDIAGGLTIKVEYADADPEPAPAP